MNTFILDLRNVKCPMNLVLVKKAVHEQSLTAGTQIIIEDTAAQNNICKYLTLKQIPFTMNGKIITIL